MPWAVMLVFNSALLGVGLAMDAFSVSLANGLHDPKMKGRRMILIAGTFAVFQAVMPLIGWICVHTIVEQFHQFEKAIPWIALFLLACIGGKMLYEGITQKEEEDENTKLTWGVLMMQGIATSIDALSVGFTIAEYSILKALVSVSIIAVVTFAICLAGLFLGKKAGLKFRNKAQILGGVILIAIGFEIFITGMF